MGDTDSVQDLLEVLGDSAGVLLGLGRAEHKIMMRTGWLAGWPSGHGYLHSGEP